MSLTDFMEKTKAAEHGKGWGTRMIRSVLDDGPVTGELVDLDEETRIVWLRAYANAILEELDR